MNQAAALIAAVAVAPFLAACGPKHEAVTAAKAAIAAQMKDPDSAQFREIESAVGERGKVVCGEVNAKNSFGAYIGYRAFVWDGRRAGIASDGELAEINASLCCTGAQQYIDGQGKNPSGDASCKALGVQF